MKKLIITTITLALSMCVLECSAGNWSELRAVKQHLALRKAVKTKPFTGTNEFGRTFWEQCQFEARAKAKQDFIRKYSTGKDDYGRSFEERETIASCFDLEEFFGFRFGDALAVETTNSLTRSFRIFKSAVLVPTCMGRLGEVYLQCNTTNVTMKSLKQEAMHVAILMEMKHGVELVERYEGRNRAAMRHEDWLRYVFENDNVKMEVELLYEKMNGSGWLSLSASKPGMIHDDVARKDNETMRQVESRCHDIVIPLDEGIGALSDESSKGFFDAVSSLAREIDSENEKDASFDRVRYLAGRALQTFRK